MYLTAVWQPRDETDNFSQKHDAELIKEEKRREVETEIRVQVDELMRQELKNLKLVSDVTSGHVSRRLTSQHITPVYTSVCLQRRSTHKPMIII